MREGAGPGPAGRGGTDGPVLSAGHVTWDEYRAKFLASKGFDEKDVAEKIKNNEDLKLDEESRNRA